MNKLFNAGFVGVVVITLTATATASGPKWEEMGDAGSLPPGQPTIGSGTLGFINGSLGMAALFGGMVDFEDMFLINIVDPMNFRATTDPNDPDLAMAFANFNSQLWLFQPTADPLLALGFLGNDDHPGVGSDLSLLIPMPTDGSPALVDPGLYYIAITRFNHDPFSAGGEIFAFDPLDPFEISGPDGRGGPFKITGWAGDPGGDFAGEYSMALRGVEFAPAPGALSLFIIAAVGARRRRRRSLLR
ncbi:MAG: hypothetical protein IIA64_09250 [Planctomycetes bacterium]|nr:hypothetical protein [Planctomycetota bacterium]